MLEMSSCEISSEEDQIVLKKRSKFVSNVLSESEAEDQMESSDDKTETSRESQSSILNKQDQDNVKMKNLKPSNVICLEWLMSIKLSLKKLRQEENANGEEFFAFVTYQKVPAGRSAAKFGRHLGCAMYGKGEQFKLQSLIIGAHRVAKTFELWCLKMNVQSLNLLCEENIPNSRKQHTKTLAMPLIKWV